MSTMQIKHPAKYSQPILDWLRPLVHDDELILDPFAGVGLVHTLSENTVGIEIEPEWASCHPRTIVGNALYLPFADRTFDTVITSPTYGNRFADKHNARDGSTRRSYTHDLRAMTADPERNLHPDNSGTMQWGIKYQEFHRKAWREVQRVLKPEGRFLLNVSDHVRSREVIQVTRWHHAAAVAAGFSFWREHKVETSRLKYGENRERVEYESILVFVK